MIKTDLEQLVAAAVRRAQDAGLLPPVQLPETLIERPQKPEHGDYASSVPLKLARSAQKRPLEIAKIIAEQIAPHPAVGKVEIAPPGFVNFTLDPAWLQQQVQEIRREGEDFGTIDDGRGRSIQLEFVSANPTGPAHAGNGRGAVIGSTLANVLRRCGWNVQTEYYVNDAGAQTKTFARTLYARYQQQFGRDVAVPADGYPGEYVVRLAAEIAGEQGDRYLAMPEDEATAALGEVGIVKMVELLKRDLAGIGVVYDRWYSERSIFESGLFDEAMTRLRENGYVEEREGAVWFSSTALGDDKDNVIIRSTGTPTYFASDIAYHYDKIAKRGFDRVVDVWGADHQGHVPRMKSVLTALGLDANRLDVILYQLVMLKRAGKEEKLSKRAGNVVELREVAEEVGRDATRYFFLMRSADSAMEFDVELAKSKSMDNPIYYVQYAHARACAVLRTAAEADLSPDTAEVAGLGEVAELDLVRRMLQFPELLELMAARLEPHHLAYFALDLAKSFTDFYEKCRVIDREDLPRSAARLQLVDAARIVLANTLALIGASAPERM